MKIAFCNRPSWNSPLGGDGIQMLSTKQSLERLYGLDIDIITNPEFLTKDYALVHIFNFATSEITEQFFDKAVQIGLPIVSSTIYWDYSYACTYVIKKVLGFTNCLTESRMNLEKMLLHFLYFNKTPKYTSYWFKRKLRKFVRLSNILLPNSYEEAIHLLEFTDLNNSSEIKTRIHVVYNGVSTNHGNHIYLSKPNFLSKYSLPDHYILQVGRIEYVKNQINLVYALRKHKDIPIVFVGKPVQSSYFNKLKEISDKRGNVFFINAVPHDEITLFYRYADLHILPSLRESPGLVSLEAARENCPIVVTNERFCPVKTYFSNCPYVINPLNINDMERTILKAYKEKSKTSLDFEKLSWDFAARQTYEAYCNVFKHD